jgi:hypothetical protein
MCQFVYEMLWPMGALSFSWTTATVLLLILFDLVFFIFLWLLLWWVSVLRDCGAFRFNFKLVFVCLIFDSDSGVGLV